MVSANYTPDITPLILAAHKNNYEILKILLDRGASLPTPHDLKCSCEACITASQEDSLRFSLSRINSYRALASPSLIALTRYVSFALKYRRKINWSHFLILRFHHQDICIYLYMRRKRIHIFIPLHYSILYIS